MTAFSPKGVVAGSFPRKPFKIIGLAGLLTYSVVSGLPTIKAVAFWVTTAVGAHSSGTVRDLHPIPF